MNLVLGNEKTNEFQKNILMNIFTITHLRIIQNSARVAYTGMLETEGTKITIEFRYKRKQFIRWTRETF